MARQNATDHRAAELTIGTSFRPLDYDDIKRALVVERTPCDSRLCGDADDRYDYVVYLRKDDDSIIEEQLCQDDLGDIEVVRRGDEDK
jgi:hypothetical protein